MVEQTKDADIADMNDVEDLFDDEAIEAFCLGIDNALDEVMGSKVTDYDFLVKVLNEAMTSKASQDDFVASLMQKDELIEVGVFRLAHSEEPKPEALPRE